MENEKETKKEVKQPDYTWQHKDIGLLMATQAVAEIEDPVCKAVYIFRNYAGDQVLSMSSIISYFKITLDQFRHRVWSTILGYTNHTGKKPRYMAPVHEERLAEIIDLNLKKNDKIRKEEILSIVR
jgi:hypothetical protein